MSTTKFTRKAMEALRELIPEIPPHCTKVVLTLEYEKPVEIEVTFYPDGEFFDGEEDDYEYTEAETQH